MSLLGIDIGTTGCKACVFSEEGHLLASAYEEYDCLRPQPGWAELDSAAVWAQAKRVIAQAAGGAPHDPIKALSVSSLGEAVVPIDEAGRVLGPSILNFDTRGEEYLDGLAARLPNERLYAINGNTLGNHYGLTKLLWLREHDPALFAGTDTFLLWGSFVQTMLGAEPAVDFSLANRTLLFDIEREDWSEELLAWAGLDKGKLPRPVPSGTRIGTVAPQTARELGLPPDVAIVAGAHDQCANALGCGVIAEGRAMLGMGTYLCMAPVFTKRPPVELMMARGLNTEHHSVPGTFVCFIYNHAGSLVKWYRDSFARAEHRAAQERGESVYPDLFREVPAGPSGIMVLPHFSITGPPHFISDSSGVVAGLRLETSRGAVLKGILEGALFYLRECIEDLPETGITVQDFRAVGGGSRSDVWLQVAADILDRPLTRPRVTEAGALGAAILAGTAIGAFASLDEGVHAMVSADRTFEPDSTTHAAYEPFYQAYRDMWPRFGDWLREYSKLRPGLPK